MTYSRQEILIKCTDAMFFYKRPEINYIGTSTEEELYTEIIADYVLTNIEAFSGIETQTREDSYWSNHSGETEQSNESFEKEHGKLNEKRIAIDLFNKHGMGKTKLDFIGNIIDYETPLNNKQDDGFGAIDLLAKNEGKLYILELKRPDSEESMLRCVLEGYTYSKIVNKKKLIDDFVKAGVLQKNEISQDDILVAPLVFRNKYQHTSFKENKMPKLRELMKELGNIEPFYMEKDEESGMYKIYKD